MPSALEIMLLSGGRDEDMQRALSSQLRRRQEIGELAQLTGDRVLTPMGQNLVESVSQSQQLEMTRADKAAQRELTADYYNQLGEQQGLTHALAVRRQEELERQNAWLRENGSLAERRFADRQMRDDETDLRRLGQDMMKAGVPEMNRLSAEITSLTQDFFPGGSREGEDIPSLGLGGMRPSITLSAEGRSIRRALSELNNRLLRIRSGAAVTTPEAQRLAEELGVRMDSISTDAEFISAWPSIVQGLQYIEAAVTSSYRGPIVAEYTENFNAALRHADASGQMAVEEGPIDPDMTPEGNPMAAPVPTGTW